MNMLEDIYLIAKKRTDTETMMVVAQAAAQISAHLHGGSSVTVASSVKNLGFIHEEEEEESDDS
jgi:hypothetical protein